MDLLPSKDFPGRGVGEARINSAMAVACATDADPGDSGTSVAVWRPRHSNLGGP